MAQGNALPPLETTVANLPSTKRDSRIYLLTDAANYGDVSTGSGSVRGLVFWDGSAWIWLGIAFVDSSGKIGVGTLTPSQILHIKSSGSVILLLDAGVASNASFQFENTTQKWKVRLRGTSSDEFDIRDATNNTTPFLIESGAPDDSIRIGSGGNIGIRTASPDGTLHVHTATAGSVTANSVADDLVVEHAGAEGGGISILSPDDKIGQLVFGSPSDSLGAIVRWVHDDNEMTIGTDNAGDSLVFKVAAFAEAMRLESTKQLRIANASADPSTVANSSHLYAKDVASSSEIFVQDEAGNATQLSPHNSKGEWEFYSRNSRTGRTVRVNMERMIRKLEELTGEKFIEEEWS